MQNNDMKTFFKDSSTLFEDFVKQLIILWYEYFPNCLSYAFLPIYIQFRLGNF